MKCTVIGVAALALTLAGCLKYPEPYRPPIQRRPMELTESGKLKHFIYMNAPDAPNYFITDILLSLNDGTWRWTLKSPTLQFQLPSTQSMKLRADITVPEVTFKQTGPVKITVSVGGHVLDVIEFAQHGQRDWEKAVPAEWLTTAGTVIVRMEIDKIWVSPADGVQRGFILSRIGFVQ